MHKGYEGLSCFGVRSRAESRVGRGDDVPVKAASYLTPCFHLDEDAPIPPDAVFKGQAHIGKPIRVGRWTGGRCGIGAYKDSARVEGFCSDYSFADGVVEARETVRGGEDAGGGQVVIVWESCGGEVE